MKKINILFQLTRHNFSEIPYFHCEQTKPVRTRSSEILTLPPDPPPTDPPYFLAFSMCISLVLEISN